jgi:hypothetical protein
VRAVVVGGSEECGGVGWGGSLSGGSGGRACQSLVPHDDDQPSNRVQAVGQYVLETDVLEERLQRLEQPAAPQVGVGGSGEGESERGLRSRRVDVEVLAVHADEEGAVGCAAVLVLNATEVLAERLAAEVDEGCVYALLGLAHEFEE